ncbi:glycosyltransferase family 2 protein [Schleiferiaceae bacterium]|nr:glycosyltransferase family 2 protein [Schleiferiaceae bacterium]
MMTHVKSFDYIFGSIHVIVDSKTEYYLKARQYVSDLFRGSDQLIELVHLDNVGGAAARNYIVENRIYMDFDYISYCDDDDIPLMEKFIYAEQYLSKNSSCVGYTCSYYRDYGSTGKSVRFEKSRIYYNDIVQNNDIGGFSFVTLNTQFLNDSCVIPKELRSNQDWFLWIKLLFDYRTNYFYKDSFIGLVYSDDKKKHRLTTLPDNKKSTYLFYNLCERMFNVRLESALAYFYYKAMRDLEFRYLLKTILINRRNLKLQSKHVISLFKTILARLL